LKMPALPTARSLISFPLLPSEHISKERDFAEQDEDKPDNPMGPHSDDDVRRAGTVCVRLGNHAVAFDSRRHRTRGQTLPVFLSQEKTMKIYITTSIPYVNARPHIGHALELVQADAMARYHRLIGNRVVFQTGTDENAFKNVLAARELGISTRELVDRNSRIFRDLADALEISADTFIRTTEERHRRGVHALWTRLRPGDLYKKPYRGSYCIGCEEFKLDKDLVDGRCPDHGAEPVPVEEENIFFRLSAYGEKLERLIDSDAIRVVPVKRKNEVLSFIRTGLQDISVSRDAERAGGWGIPVPDDRSQVIYVWIDALINYISGQGFGSGDEWRGIWNPDVRKIHVIGKNVWKFHAVYWPALLLSAGLPLPDEIAVHGFLTVEGQKMSKSLGNVLDPFDCIRRHGVDALRYYLLKGISPFEDGDYSPSQEAHIYNADLANGLGNLVSRLWTLGFKSGVQETRDIGSARYTKKYRDAMGNYRFGEALGSLWDRLARINRDIDRGRPWELLRDGRDAEVRSKAQEWVSELVAVARELTPFLPHIEEKIRGILNRQAAGEAAVGVPAAAAPAHLFPRIVL
jgi:methionyl-tRNA synthetase